MRLSRDQGLMICDYCGSQATPQVDEDGVVVMDTASHDCPVCKTPLANALIETQELLYCTRCKGMLLEMEKLLALLDVLREYRYWSRSSRAPVTATLAESCTALCASTRWTNIFTAEGAT